MTQRTTSVTLIREIECVDNEGCLVGKDPGSVLTVTWKSQNSSLCVKISWSRGKVFSWRNLTSLNGWAPSDTLQPDVTADGQALWVMPLAQAPSISAILGLASFFYLPSLPQCMITSFSRALLRLRDGLPLSILSFHSVKSYKMLDSLNEWCKSLVCCGNWGLVFKPWPGSLPRVLVATSPGEVWY